ncbi:MAG: DUF1045 domain-containing protein [Rhodospirillaceae bacterium]|nr:DUF1045 domain-containing protein [Rhodospirillaceae bacterium]
MLPLTPRYAIYYSPDPGSPLAAFSQAWFGPDSGLTSALDRPYIDRITTNTRRYGFHGTLKPPFELNPILSLDGLMAAARIFARTMATVELPPLELAVIGKFIALTPAHESAALEKLAAACVRAFEAFRVPMSAEQFAQYKLNKLTVHQEQMLKHWGYPYVMEEFRFHMSLTDKIEDEAERIRVMDELAKIASPVVGKPLVVRAITVFRQPGSNEPMVPVERIPFGRG